MDHSEGNNLLINYLLVYLPSSDSMLNLHAQIGMSRRLLLDQAKAKQTEILLFLLDPRLLRNVCQRLCDEKFDYGNEILSKSHLRFM